MASWVHVTDCATPYWWHAGTNEVSWTGPPAATPQRQRLIDEASGAAYWWDPNTNEVSWEEEGSSASTGARKGSSLSSFRSFRTWRMILTS